MALKLNIKLNPREQKLATIFAGVLGFIVFIGIPIGLELLVQSRKTENDEVRAAIESVQAARAQVRARQSKKEAIAQRYQRRAVPLAGFLEQTARAQKLEVTDSADRPELPHGKRYVERSTVIHLKKAGMAPIAKFLESIETSGYATSLTRLNVRRRMGEPNSYDVEVGLSAYDRNAESTPSGDSSDANKGDKSDKEKR